MSSAELADRTAELDRLDCASSAFFAMHCVLRLLASEEHMTRLTLDTSPEEIDKALDDFAQEQSERFVHGEEVVELDPLHRRIVWRAIRRVVWG